MAKFYYCPSCDTVYNDFFKPGTGYYTPCPKADCNGEVFEVDELMLPAIRLMNIKGYLTEFCCSGHWAENFVSPYVKFYEVDEEERKHMKDTLPEPWYFDDENTIRVNPDYFGEKSMNRFKKICEVNCLLFNWADNLMWAGE